ncbi:hypothetical protein V6N12_046174 [Hibiscus sabdariffa]|uniref:Uncharacterized protein n=1 Tax=Hibiscus sabdariffa TaxID=183260 RepID=A0ABR2B6M3_9ROSI
MLRNLRVFLEGFAYKSSLLMLSFSSCVASPLKADLSFLSPFNHPFPLQHFHISQKSCSDVVSVVCISSSEGHRQSLSEFVMDREKGEQRVAAEKDCGEYDQWLGNEPSFCLKGRWIGGGITVQVHGVLGSSSFRRYHLSNTVGYWVILAPDGKMFVTRSLEEEDTYLWVNGKKVFVYYEADVHQTLESSTLVGKMLAGDCLKEAGKGLRANESLAFENSTVTCLFSTVGAMPIMSDTFVWKQRDLQLSDLISRFMGILFPKLVIFYGSPID